MDNPEIRKELLGRDSAWIAERIARADALNAELLEALEWSKIIVGAVCDDMLLPQPHMVPHVIRTNDPVACVKAIHEAIRKAKEK